MVKGDYCHNLQRADCGTSPSSPCIKLVEVEPVDENDAAKWSILKGTKLEIYTSKSQLPLNYRAKLCRHYQVCHLKKLCMLFVHGVESLKGILLHFLLGKYSIFKRLP